MKKVILLITVVCLLIITASAPMAAEKADTSQISLNAAISKALEYDKTDRIMDIDIRLKTSEAEDAVKNAKYPDREQEIYDQYNSLSIPAKQIWKEITPLEKQFEVDKLIIQKKESDEQLVNKVTNSFFNALFNDTKAKLSEEDKNIAKKDLEIVQSRYKIGQVSEIALKEAQLAYDKVELNYAAAIDDRDYSLNDIADLLGVSGDACILASEKITQDELPEYSKAAFMELLKKNNITYLNAVKDQEFKQKRYDIYMEITRYGVGKEESAAEKELINANIALRKTTKDEIIQMYSEYIDLLNLKGDIEVARGNLEVSKAKVKQKEIQFEKGLITELGLKKEQLIYSKAELVLYQEINTFNLRTSTLMLKLK